jgi:putative CRISPR-associated protein (TIGR02619 family)
MKEFHIISVGVSILTNAQRAKIINPNIKISDNDEWQRILENPNEIQKIVDFIKSNPKKNSAELNTFLRVVQDKEPKNIEVYLFGTNTYSNELCRVALEKFLKENGYTIYIPKEFSGYFWEAQNYDEKFAIDEFKKGISSLLDKLIYLANRKKKEGYKVYFNSTGGFKAHVIASALAGFLTNSEVYYMNEEFNDVVFLPNLFYLPKGREIELLNILKNKEPISEQEFKNLYNKYNDEFQRLSLYGLIEIEEDIHEKPYRIRITNKGHFILKTIESYGRL